MRFIDKPGCYVASAAATAAVNPNSSKTVLANGLSTSSIKCNQSFSNVSKSLPKNPPDSPILCNWAFDSFILAKELFPKALQNLKTC